MDALNLKGSYVIAEEMASLYVDVSRQDITPALSYLEHFELVDNEDAQSTSDQKVSEIIRYSLRARDKISAKAEEVCTNHQTIIIDEKIKAADESSRDAEN